MQRDVVIIGAGINGNLTAAYLKAKQPDLDVVVLDRGREKLPLIGESLTEFSTHFLRSLGLGQHLEDSHYHKYGLTFYFKERLADPMDRTYCVHEAPAIPPMQSSLINRYVFDPELRRRNEQSGVEYLQATATSLEQIDDGFSIGIKSTSGDQVSVGRINAKWTVDCSGRSRVLSRQLGLNVPYSGPQRSCFWFRLVDFDPELLGRIDAIKEQQSSFDSYYTTHHFMGRNNWAWCIPMRPHDRYTTLMSVGVVWRPDLADLPIRSVESFTNYFRNEHPVLADLVAGGSILDHGLYRNYMYEASKVYASDGWFIVGDAADTVDPLYSTGLVLSTLQITQVESMISDARQGRLSQSRADALESAYKLTRAMMQNEISDLYEVAHDCWQCHWRVYISSLIYFHLMLPAWLAGYMTDPKGAKWMARFLGVSKSNTASLRHILKLSAENPNNGNPREFPNRYAETINWKLSRGNELELPKHLSTMLMRLAKYRFLFWRRSGFKDIRQQSWSLTLEIAGGILFGSVLRRMKLRNLAPREAVPKRTSEKLDFLAPSNQPPHPQPRV